MLNNLMNNKKTILMFLSIFIISIISISNVHALMTVVRENQITPRGFSIPNSNSNEVYMLCKAGECDYYGFNATIIKYNLLTNIIDRRDFTNAYPPTYVSQVGYVGTPLDTYRQLEMGSGYYLGQYIKLSLGNPVDVYQKVYKYSSYTNTWTLFGGNLVITPLASIAYLTSNNVIYQNAPSIVMNNLRNNNAPDEFYYQYQYTVGDNYGLFKINRTDKVVYYGGTDNMMMLENRNASAISLIYTINTSGIGRYGIVDESQNFVAYTNKINYYYGLLNDTIASLPLKSLQTVGQNCYGIINKPITITDFDCKNARNCVLIGNDTIAKHPIILNVIDDECYLEDMNIFDVSGTGINFTGKPLYSIKYNRFNDKYYIAGKNILFTYTQSFVNVSFTPKCLGTLIQSGNTYAWNISGSTSICTSPIPVTDSWGFHYTCAIDNTQYCGNGCYEDSSGIATCSQPSQSTCTSTCNIQGATRCLDSTTIQKCDDYEGLGCLTYQTSSTCNIGQYCASSYNLGSCQNVTQNGTHSAYGLTVTPYTVSSNSVTYSNDASSRTVSVSTTNSLQQIDFYTSGTTYISRTCNYNEITQLSTGFENISNGNSSFNTLPSALAQDTIVRINFLPSNFETGRIRIESSLGVNDGTLYYMRNSTLKNICIYDTSYNPIYCDYSTNSYDDLKSVSLEYNYVFVANIYTIKITFNRAVNNIIITQPQLFSGNDIFAINITSTNFTTSINEEIVTTPSTFNSFTANNGGTTIKTVISPTCNCGTLACSEYKLLFGQEALNQLCGINVTVNNFVESCIYTTKGTFKVRTYGNNNGIPDYSVYTDYNVNMKDFGLSQQELENEAKNQAGGGFVGDTFGTGLSTGTKLLYAIMITLVALILTVIVCMYGDLPSGLTGGLAGIVVIGCLILFAFIGFIPIWVIIMMAILSAGIIALAMKSMVN